MDEKTKILICMAAATAANCIPCFEYYYGKAQQAGISSEEVEETTDLAGQVKKGAHMALRNSVSNLMGREKEYRLPCDRQASSSCCK